MSNQFPEVGHPESHELDFLEVKPGEPFVRILRPTVLKSSVDQSGPSNSLASLEAGFEFDIESWSNAENGHILVSLAGEDPAYLFAEHIELVGINKTPVQVGQQANKGQPMKLPGYSSMFYSGNPILPGSHFTWGEATRNWSRMPTSQLQVDQIVAVSQHLDNIRSLLGNRPMRITSWLRPPAVNVAVGGARFSRHIQGDGVDFVPLGRSLWDAQRQIEPYCRMNNMGLGLGAPKGFIHVDLGGWRKWNY